MTSPTVWRRWLALELKRRREAAGLSVAEVAKHLDCSSPKVSYMEHGRRAVSEADLAVMLDLYGIAETERPRYQKAARDARRKEWWERYDERTIPQWHSLFVGLEAGASRLRIWEPQIVTGLLQTPEYAAAVLQRGPAPRSEEQVERAVEMRMTRQAALTRDPDPLELWVIFDEGALRRVVGGPDVMAGQIEHLAKMAERPNITLQVLPFAAGAHGATHGRFTLMSFPLPDDHGLVYVEYRSGAVYLQGSEVDDHSLSFAQLASLALPPDQWKECL